MIAAMAVATMLVLMTITIHYEVLRITSDHLVDGALLADAPCPAARQGRKKGRGRKKGGVAAQAWQGRIAPNDLS